MANKTFSFTIEPYEGLSSPQTFYVMVQDWLEPFIENESPYSGQTGVDGYSLISMDILDDATGVNRDSINIYLNSSQIFTGPSTFISPWTGPSSTIYPTTVDGYSGFHIDLDSFQLLPPSTNFNIRVVASDNYGNILDDDWDFITNTGIESLTVGEFEINLHLKFSGDMNKDEQLINPSNYSFNRGMYARLVEIISDDKIRLWVENFYGEGPFTLNVSNNIRDSYGDYFTPSYSTTDIIPFQSEASVSNSDGKIRTWHESNIVLNDTKRMYLAGTRGIDIFKKGSHTNFYRWAQIFDEYGIDSMYVANFPSDLEITDESAPYLYDRIPPPSSFASSDTNISFKVKDNITSVEITTLRAYVNGLLVFSGGYGGWQNGWSGIINVEYKQLSVELWSDSFFPTGSVVAVRIIAQDLLGNELDETYNFSIAIPLGGFGGTPFGTSSFGGI